MHYQVARHGESRCGANFVLCARIDITWAVMDSGIDAKHPHFVLHGNVDPTSPLHADFTDTPNIPKGGNAALIDRFGHGTHVAGIVAGEQVADGPKAQPQKMRAVTRSVRGYEEGIRLQ